MRTLGTSPTTHSLRKRRWLRYFWLGMTIPAAGLGAMLAYYYVTFARIIDERLQVERVRALPRIFARPYELRRGMGLSPAQLGDRLNDLEYALRASVERPGEFAVGRDTILLMVREGPFGGNAVRVTFRALRSPAAAPRPVVRTSGDDTGAGHVIDRLEIVGGSPVDRVILEPPLLTALMKDAREKRRHVELAAIPPHMIRAVIAIEDRRFYSHPGVDVIRAAAALLTNIRGDKPYLVGASTLTQQLVRNFFLTPEKTLQRKLLEQFMSIILERRASKDEILELYLNDVYLGQRGSFAIHGVAQAARLFFGKDVSNLSLSEAATIAGVIQTANHSPFNSLNRARDRRNVVLRAMAESGFITEEAAQRASHDPIKIVPPALENEAPYFVDFLGQVLEQYPALSNSPQAVDFYTTLDLHLQRIAHEVVSEGAAHLDQLLARRKRTAQIALIALDPRTGQILAMVGGRSYSRSQYNRAVTARRQPGSVFKPFVYLAAFEEAAAQNRSDLTPATLVEDEQTTFLYEDKEWTPANYEDEYDGMITLRRALAMSRNVATIKVAESVGYRRVADLWTQIGAGTPPRPYPSIALGVFEASPLEIAAAYTIFPNLGELQPVSMLMRAVSGGEDLLKSSVAPRRRVARPETTFLVTNMMRSVINEGTGAAARALGFALDAAGKSGTTNDMRDAWFVGFTPELLTTVWVGLDDNSPLGLSGSRAALPIWSAFMMRALAGHSNISFDAPGNIVFTEIDRDTGKVAVPGCPRVINEAFLPGTEPWQLCELHRF